MAVKTRKVGDVTITLDTTKLDLIANQLLKRSYVEVGILGDKNARDGKGTNAAIGAVHEFGSLTRNIPRRSFLEMPLVTQLPMQNAQIKRDLARAMAKKDYVDFIETFLKRVAIRAEGVIQDAFRTGGFGTWEPSKKVESYHVKHTLYCPVLSRNKGPQTLIDTGQLRASISSRIVIGGSPL